MSFNHFIEIIIKLSTTKNLMKLRTKLRVMLMI